MTNKKTLVLGASPNPARYSHLAVNKLASKGHDVTAIGKRAGKIGNVEIVTGQKEISDLDTVTLYLNANNQKQYYDFIISQKPKRIIFNPGAENDELAEMAKKNGILPQEACTLVLLSTGQY
ncbi:MAG: CoA-binding protein [Chitinophagaceae bacterium]